MTLEQLKREIEEAIIKNPESLYKSIVIYDSRTDDEYQLDHTSISELEDNEDSFVLIIG